MARLRTQYSTVTSSAGSVVARTSAPASPHVGLRWYNTATGVTYQWTSDGTSSFWVDITSGGIGTSASRSVDFVGDTDPHLETATVGGGLAVGSVYYNREDNRYFTCTTATDNANVWVGRYAGAGGTETTYKSGTDFYRVHTFIGNDTFFLDDITACDILIIAGGGGGGEGSAGAGGGGGAGGFKYYPAKSTTAGKITVTVGTGSIGATAGSNRGAAGTNSSFGALVSLGGGSGGSQNTNVQPGLPGGSGGGGGQRDDSNANDGAGTANQGNNGGSGHESGGMVGGGGGGAGAVGASGTSGAGGAGGAGITEGATVYNWTADSGTVTFPAAFKVGSGGNLSYAGGGGGGGASSHGAGGTGGGGNAAGVGAGGNGTANSGSGGGANGGDGGSGIVIVRYQLNA